MSKVKDTEYLFLSMQLQAKESQMLTKDKLERMLTEPGFEDAAGIAVECGYEDMSGMDARQIDEALARRRAREFEEIRDYLPEKELLDIFSLKYDYHNAKAIVKAGGCKPEIEYLLSGGARSDVRDIIAAYDDDAFADIPAEMIEAIREAKNLLARTGNPQLSDVVLDKCYFRELREMMERHGSPQLMGYIRTRIDSANLRTALRIMLSGKREELLSLALIDGGSVGADEILHALTKEDVLTLFSGTDLREATLAPSMTIFERAADNAENAYLAGAKKSNFGPGEVVTYLSALETEIMSLRIVLTGKRLGIDPNQLRERLREIYV